MALIGNFDDLTAMEERIKREREECERLENQIKMLALESEKAEASFARSPAAAPPPPVPVVAQAPAPVAAALRVPAATPGPAFAPTAAAPSPMVPQQLPFNTPAAEANRGRAKTPGRSGPQVALPAAAAPTVPDRPSPGGQSTMTARTSASTVRTTASTAGGKVTYRSSMYRSASPSKRVKDGVVISSFGRDARFKDQKTDVPGPGKYAPHATDFAPVTVANAIDKEGQLGHTWAQYLSSQGLKPTPAQQHAQAMAAATARVRSPSPGAASSSLSDTRSVTGTIVGEGTVESAAQILINGAHGNARLALELTLKRERALRKEVGMLRTKANELRLEAGNHASQLANEIEKLKATVAKRETAFTAQKRKAALWGEHVTKLEHSASTVYRSLIELAAQLGQGDAETAIRKNAALNRAVEMVRGMESQLAAARATASEAVASSGASVVGPGDTGAGGFTAYSSLSAALAAPQPMGQMGGSARVVAAAPPPKAVQAGMAAASPRAAPRERPLTGAQARGINVADVASFVNRTVAASTAAASQPGSPVGAAVSSPTSSPGLAAYTTAAPSSSRSAQAPAAAEFSRAAYSVQDQLQHLFLYFAKFGDRNADGSSLSVQDFARLIREAGVVDGRAVTQTRVDLAFTRAAASAGTPGRPAMSTAARLNFDSAIVALTEIASLKYGSTSGGGSGGEAPLLDPNAFRRLLDEYILPLHTRLRSDPTFSALVLGGSSLAPSSDQLVADFSDEFLRPDVLAFLNTHRAALQDIFAAYAGLDTAGSGARSWNAIREGLHKLSRKELLQFASDYKIIPDMCNRAELMSLVQEVTKASGLEGESADAAGLAYPEFVELLGLIAYSVDVRQAQAGQPLTAPGSGMLEKLHMLLFTLHQRGAPFQGEGAKMIRLVQEAVRERSRSAASSAAASARATAGQAVAQVQRILGATAS